MNTFSIFYVFDSAVDRIVRLQLSEILSFCGWCIPRHCFGSEYGKTLGRRHAMKKNVGWQELYQAAMLELRPDQMRRRIDEAEKAIQQRIVELTQHDSSSE